MWRDRIKTGIDLFRFDQNTPHNKREAPFCREDTKGLGNRMTVKKQPVKKIRKTPSSDLVVINSVKELVKIEDKEERALWNFLIGTKNSDKLTDQQKLIFIETAKTQKLNPLKREIYAIPYQVKDWKYEPDNPYAKKSGDKKGYVYKNTDKYELTIVTGYEVYLKRAQADPRYLGYKTKFGTFSFPKIDDNGNVMNENQQDITCTIVIYRKGMPDFEHQVFWSECFKKNNPMWKNSGIPKTMLRKVAIAQGHRLCYTKETDGLPYIFEEHPDLISSFADRDNAIENKEIKQIENIEKEKIPDELIKQIDSEIKEGAAVVGYNTTKKLNDFVMGMFPGEKNWKSLSYDDKKKLMHYISIEVDKQHAAS